MERRRLGSSDLDVSSLALGTMTFGAEADEPTSWSMLDEYLDAGGNLIDTADVYSNGLSEEIVGRWMAERSNRDAVLVATKGRFPMPDAVGDAGASASYLTRACEASLRRLGIETIDLYQVHAWDPAVPVEETLGGLDALVQQGKVRQIGVSNYAGWQLQKAVLTARLGNTAPIVALQPLYNLLSREIEWELLPQCIEEEIGVLPWSPLAGGWLTGKYRSGDAPPETSRIGDDPTRGTEAAEIRDNDRTWRVLAAVEEVAQEREVSVAEVALAWVRQRPGVTSVILGARTVDQLRANLASAALELTDDEMARLTEVSAPGVAVYPQAFLEKYCGYRAWAELGTRTELPPIGD